MYTNLQKELIAQCVLPFIPKNKRGFSSRFDMADIFKCIVYKLKTGCQWRLLFVDIQGCKSNFSWQTVYYYYRKWCSGGVFKSMFETYLEIQKDKLDTEQLNLDGTHSLVKKSAQSAAYQYRKRGRASNILIMTDGNGIPIAQGGVLSGNHNDLFEIVPQYSQMIKHLNNCGICVENSIQNADKGFDSKTFRRAIQRRKMIPNIIEKHSKSQDKKARKKKRFKCSSSQK